MCLCQTLYSLAQKGNWKLMAHGKPVSVATGEKRVWARGDTQEDKRAEEEAELNIEGRRRVPSTVQEETSYEGFPKPGCVF